MALSCSVSVQRGLHCLTSYREGHDSGYTQSQPQCEENKLEGLLLEGSANSRTLVHSEATSITFPFMIVHYFSVYRYMAVYNYSGGSVITVHKQTNFCRYIYNSQGCNRKLGSNSKKFSLIYKIICILTGDMEESFSRLLP